MLCLKLSSLCVFGWKLGKWSVNLAFVSVLGLMHINFIFERQCTNIVYLFSDNSLGTKVNSLHTWTCCSLPRLGTELINRKQTYKVLIRATQTDCHNESKGSLDASKEILSALCIPPVVKSSLRVNTSSVKNKMWKSKMENK